MRNIQLNRIVLAGCIFILLIFACDKWDYERAFFTQVITVGALEVGFSSAFLLGDIEGLRNANITETGFVYSSTANNDQSLRLAQENVEVVMSPRLEDSIITEDRAFAARATDLGASTKYFFRAYIGLEGSENAYGAIDTFTTSNLIISVPTVISTSSDCLGSANITVNIAGARQSPGTSFGVVWSDNQNIMFPSLASGIAIETSKIDPAGDVDLQFTIECNTVYFLRGYYKTAEAETYGPVISFTTTAGGTWIPASDFQEDFGRDACHQSFATNTHGFVAGWNADNTNEELWKFDPINLNWQPALDPPFFNEDCIGTVGADSDIIFVGGTGRWQYFPNDQWVPVINSIPEGEFGFTSFNFVFLNRRIFYWGTGWQRAGVNQGVVSTVKKQSQDAEAPEILDDFPGGARYKTSYFVLDGKGYVGLGQDLEGNLFSDFWALDFTSTSWSQKMDLPDEFRPSLSFTTDNKAYLLTGYDAEDSPLANFYEYDPDVDQWTQLTDFGLGDGTADIGFAIDGAIYGGLGISASGEVKREIWRYVPELE